MNLPSTIIPIAAQTIDIFFRALSFLIIMRILLSWVAPHSRGNIVIFIHSTTQSIFDLFRRLPLRIGMIDLTPLVAIITINFTREILLKILFGLQ